MHFTSTKLSLIFIALASIVKSDIIAFNGNECDGSEGSNVACDGSCHAFTGRHSYRVVASGARCVTYFLNSGCNVNVGSNVNPGSGACTNVNTGTAVASFRCSPNSVCQNVAGGQPLLNVTNPSGVDDSKALPAPAIVNSN